MNAAEADAGLISSVRSFVACTLRADGLSEEIAAVVAKRQQEDDEQWEVIKILMRSQLGNAFPRKRQINASDNG